MNAKVGIGIGVSALVLILGIWAWTGISGLTAENAQTETLLKDALAKHQAQAEVSQALTSAGYKMVDSQGKSTGTGPDHQIIIVSKHVTLDLGYNEEGHLTSYKIDHS